MLLVGIMIFFVTSDLRAEIPVHLSGHFTPGVSWLYRPHPEADMVYQYGFSLAAGGLIEVALSNTWQLQSGLQVDFHEYQYRFVSEWRTGRHFHMRLASLTIPFLVKHVIIRSSTRDWFLTAGILHSTRIYVVDNWQEVVGEFVYIPIDKRYRRQKWRVVGGIGSTWAVAQTVQVRVTLMLQWGPPPTQGILLFQQFQDGWSWSINPRVEFMIYSW